MIARKPSALLALLSCAALVACAGDDAAEDDALGADTLATPPAAGAADGAGRTATARLTDAEGNSVGTATLTGEDGGVQVSVRVSGLESGPRGFHIHETGSCEPPSFSSASGHLAPAGNAHGFDAVGGPHAGDLRNLTVGPDSTATIDQTSERVTLRDGGAPLLDADGAALVIHTGPDDYVSQPSGNSGDPIACGVIEG